MLSASRFFGIFLLGFGPTEHILGAFSTVTGRLSARTVLFPVMWNPTRSWWDKSIEEINDLIPVLTNSDLEWAKSKLKKMMEK